MIYTLPPTDLLTIAPGGALANATALPLTSPLTVAIPSGAILDYGGTKFARLSQSGAVGDDSLVVDPIPTAFAGGESVVFYPEVGFALLPSSWAASSGQYKAAQQNLAENYLELSAPAYQGTDGDSIILAIVLQINLQIQQGTGPQVVKSESDSHPGVTTAYWDRVIHPGAALIVQRVTGKRLSNFAVLAAGV